MFINFKSLFSMAKIISKKMKDFIKHNFNNMKNVKNDNMYKCLIYLFLIVLKSFLL